MSNFNKIYNNIIKNIDYQPNTFDSQVITEMSNLKYRWFNVYELLNEYIEDEELTPIPKDFFIDICKQINIKNFQIIQYSYQKILNLLLYYNYEYADDFKSELNKYTNGKLYIISCPELNQNFLNNHINITTTIYNKLLQTFDEESVEDIILKAGLANNGITSTLKNYDITNYKNLYILINQSRIILQSWSVTIEHELTHFIQRIIGYDKVLQKSKISPSCGFGNYIKNKNYFDLIFNHKFSLNMQKFVAYIIKAVEQDPSVKHILSYFRLMYQYEILEQNDNIDTRLKWLTNKLNTIENVNYYQSTEWQNKLNLIQQPYEILSDNDKILFNFIHAELGYLICNRILTNKNVKEKLFNYFKKFNYGEY